MSEPNRFIVGCIPEAWIVYACLPPLVDLGSLASSGVTFNV